MDNIKVIIIDDQTLMRDGLSTILNLEDDIDVVAVAENGQKGYEAVAKFLPDVVLMDIRMPELNGVEATKLIKENYPKTAVVILTTFDDDEYILDSLSYGASGYILKDIKGDKLIQAVRDAYDGNMILPTNIALKLVEKLSEQHNIMPYEAKCDKAADFGLTEREKEIGKLIVEGCSNKEIAERIFISVGTVKNYISNLYSKLGTSNRTSTALLLKKLGL